MSQKLPPISEIFKMIKKKKPTQGIRKPLRRSFGVPVKIRTNIKYFRNGYTKITSTVIYSRIPPKTRYQLTPLSLLKRSGYQINPTVKSINALIDKHGGYLCHDYKLKILDKNCKIRFVCDGKELEMYETDKSDEFSLNSVHKLMSKMHGLTNINTRRQLSKKRFKIVVLKGDMKYESKYFVIYSLRGIEKVMWTDFKAVNREYRHLAPEKFEDKNIVYLK